MAAGRNNSLIITTKTSLQGLFILLSLICFSSFGQQREQPELIKEIDSLYRVIYKFNYYDTLSYDTAFLSFERKINDLIAEGQRSDHKGAVYKAKNVLFIHLKYKDGEEYDLETRQLLDETIDYARQKGDTLAYAQFTYLLGNFLSSLDRYDSSLVYFEKALVIAESIGNKSAEAASINALAVTYANIGRDDLAVEYYRKSLDVARLSKDSTQVLTSYGNLATVHGRLGDADSTMYYADIAYNMSQVFDEPAIKWHAINSLTVGSYLQGRYNKAIEYADMLTQQVRPIGEDGFLITSDLFRSKSLYALGNTSKAFTYAKSSLEKAKEYETKTAEIRALEWLVKLTDRAANYKDAFMYQKALTHIQDSLSKIQTNAQIDAMAARYETTQREKDIAALQRLQVETAKQQKFKNYMLFSIIALLVTGILSIYSYQKRRITKERLAQQKAKNKLLQAQMNPHFLFNALFSIQLFMINKGQGMNALEYLGKFAKLMRRILENSRKDLVSLEDEMSTLRHYLDLQKVRFDNRFDYKLTANVAEATDELMIPPMFAQPFIENSLEHGIVDRDDGLIEITFEQIGEKLKFMVSDNGIGLTKSLSMKKKDVHESMATKITKDRIELLRKQLKKNITFNIKDRFNDTSEVIGTQVIFELPIDYRL